MTFPSSSYAAAHHWRMRAEEARTFADELKESEPKAIMLRIAGDYERLAEWAEKTHPLGGTKNVTHRRSAQINCRRLMSDCVCRYHAWV
jgi:hypothetical protein